VAESITTADESARVVVARRDGQTAPTIDAGKALVALSRWIDDGNTGRDPEAITWGRIAKLAEETGEVIAAFIGATGQNPRKGITHSTMHVVDELLDVAVTALGAVEHIVGHDGSARPRLDSKICTVAIRAGVDLAAAPGVDAAPGVSAESAEQVVCAHPNYSSGPAGPHCIGCGAAIEAHGGDYKAGWALHIVRVALGIEVTP